MESRSLVGRKSHGTALRPRRHPEQPRYRHRFRFSVRVEWPRPQTGEILSARPLPLTNDSGGFRFFKPGNLELVIKVLDGRPVNGNFWILYGSLTHLQFTLTVIDLDTGFVRSYNSARGEQASGVDTQSFLGELPPFI